MPNTQERAASDTVVPHMQYRGMGRSVRATRTGRVLDWLSLALGMIGLVLMFAARADYSRWPLLGLLLPLVRLGLSHSYRTGFQDACRALWNSAETFSSQSGPLPLMAAAVFVVLPVFLFYISNGTILGAVDTVPVIPSAVSIVREGNWDLSEFHRLGRSRIPQDLEAALPGCYQKISGGIYSAFPSGMVSFAVPVTSMARLCGADLDRRLVHLRLEKITAALVASFSLGLFFMAACCLGSTPAAMVATGLLAISSGLYTTVGLGLWQHGGVVFWILTALLVELRSSGRPTRLGTVIQGIACAGLLMCRPTAALLVAGLTIWIFLHSPRRALETLAVAAAAYLPCLLMYFMIYGNVFGPATINGNMSGEFWHPGRIETMAGVLVCPARGLFVYQPWAILAFLSLRPRTRALAVEFGYRPGPSGWIGFCLSITAAHCLVISAWHDWSGGDCWGSRLLTDILPLLGLACVPAIAALWSRPRARVVIVALGVVGALTHLPCAYMNAAAWNHVTDHTSDLWSWSHPPFLYWR